MSLILARVHVGKAFRPREVAKNVGLKRYRTSLSNASQPPKGYDSVSACGGVDPFHNEVIVYSAEAAIPMYMVDVVAEPLAKKR